MPSSEIRVPERPADLTVEFLQGVLASDAATASSRVVSFSWRPMEVGVISEVVAIDLVLQDSQHQPQTQEKALIAKFLRPEFPFERMFVVESNFYQQLADTTKVKTKVTPQPFGVPHALFLSKVLIILERVSPVETYSCVAGCPKDRIEQVVERLAQFHGLHWTTDTSQLASPAGIGSELSGGAKRDQFPGAWRSFLDDVALPDDVVDTIASICERLSSQPQQLEWIHNAVVNGPSTLIHGDFHTANLLFPPTTTEGLTDQPLWLVDWATCGKGNPMRDLAFFFIVGVRSEDREDLEQASLETYAAMIDKAGVTELTLSDWQRHYRLCVLNQFLILVVYDNLSKHLASNAKSEKLRQELHAHFREVNLRACLAVLEHFREEDLARIAAL
ncbi:hypothetical protein P43SY_006426 [Pythium insidiosum]|uniref:CHK kinase-like domain-containing protein n=1 Tax=Pythium insidiosum TaxID=114742 RepID=A0AAD5M8K1_PYTIN|nr:hypothetical protein P43SY_006426 [Pythium insidiosum]